MEDVKMKVALTIAGSDSVAGAGIQADLKTFYALGVYGVSAITAVTAQNTCGVDNAVFLSDQIVGEQIDSVAADVKLSAAKTGMLANEAIVTKVASKVEEYDIPHLVVDPVLVSTSGHLLLEEQAIETIKNNLFPLATVITPNIPEAEALTGIKINTLDNMKDAAKELMEMGAKNVLIKGGHSQGDALDILYNGKEFLNFETKRIGVGSIHGTGCTLAAAIAANLAKGESVQRAVELSKQYVTEAIKNNYSLGKGSLLLGH